VTELWPPEAVIEVSCIATIGGVTAQVKTEGAQPALSNE
jgi:hypothetical protein